MGRPVSASCSDWWRMKASERSRSSADASRSAIDCSHWPSSPEKAPLVTDAPDDPKRRSPRMAAAAVARMPRSRRLGTRSAAHCPLPDDDRLIARQDVAGEPLLVGGHLGADLEADRGDGVHCVRRAAARGSRSARRAASRSARARSRRAAASGWSRAAPGRQARHRRLAVGALALGGGAPGPRPRRARSRRRCARGPSGRARCELVDAGGDDDDRRRRQQPPAQLAGVEAPVGERDARADEPEDREHGLNAAWRRPK